jgi:pyruvyltransferase
MATATLGVYWWRDEPNFGDGMNPMLLERLFGIKVEWAPLESAELAAAGSLIQWITPVRPVAGPPIHVWGSGYIFGEEPAPVEGTVTYDAVRGPSSARLSGLSEVAFGDPGLLVSNVFKAPSHRRKLGLVPHLNHRQDPVFGEIAAEFGASLIDVASDPEDVIIEIAGCDFILASSLHGLIVADSYEIPNRWVNRDPSPFGGSWKFDDYYGAFGLQPKPVDLTPNISIERIMTETRESYGRPGLDRLKDNLRRAFPFR